LPRDVEACEAIYQARLEEISARLKISKDVLHRIILRKHIPWLRANTKPSSLPPKAWPVSVFGFVTSVFEIGVAQKLAMQIR